MKMPSYKYIALGIFLCIFAFFFLGWPSEYPKQYGVTWSAPYAESLGLNSMEGLRATLDDLGVKRFRIPAYWTDIERVQGIYDFSRVSEQLDEIAKHDGQVILALGARLPRWPECWVPSWAESMNTDDRREAQLAYIQATYNVLKDHPAIFAWQIENEINFTLYAQCGGLTKDLARAEMRWVRTQESKRAQPRPVYTSESGEFSTWIGWAGEVDGVGVSLYRSVISPWIGVVRYWFVPPWAYDRKAILAKFFVDEVFVSEFQMEPWSFFPLPNTSLNDQYKTLSHEQMKRNFRYAQQLRMPAVDFWGVEWWYWMKITQDRPEFWNTARIFFRQKNINVK